MVSEYDSILQGSTSTPIVGVDLVVGVDLGMFTGVAHISGKAVPPTGKPLVIGEESNRGD